MVQDVRSSTGVVFDLLSEAGVLATIAFVRESNLPREEKRELRDLLFSYTSSGGDAALRTLIESRLTAVLPSELVKQESTPVTDGNVDNSSPSATRVTSAVASTMTNVPVPADVPVVPAATPNHGFVHRRPAPVFASVPPIVVPASTAVQTTPTVSTATPQPASHDVPLAATEASVAQARIPDPEPVLQVPKSIVDEKLVPLAPTPAPSVAFEPVYREDALLDQYRARIAEIKQMINTKVGNPVNLVDLNNEVGRAYMTALLEAMKAVSGGGGDPVSAMSRLESVVKEVEQVLVSTPVTTEVSETIPAVAVAMPETESRITEQEPALTVPVAPISPQVPVTSEDVVPISPMRIASSRFKNVLPVTEQEPLKTPADLPTAQELKARSGITDPLLDPDVDLGLEQLLGEWSLFKKSGVFGTGPKGRQHPLFLKLAPLPMPLILSGRFEGATTEIRQSITDYMNGWRYEQGVIYEQDETLEHYLRRVIRHIIDSQTRRRGA
jgi:hypothetical protein